MGELEASKMAAHFNDDDDDSIISLAVYSYRWQISLYSWCSD